MHFATNDHDGCIALTAQFSTDISLYFELQCKLNRNDEISMTLNNL